MNSMDKPKRLLFLISRFLDGGIDTVLTEYLKALSNEKNVQVTLAIGICMGDLEVYRNRLPDTVEIKYLIRAPWLTHWKRQKIKKSLSPVLKVLDELLFTPVRRLIIRKKLHALASHYDAVIDFDCCFYAYMKGLLLPRKVTFFHFSIAQLIKQNPRRMRRIEKCLTYYDKVIFISQGMYEEAKSLFPPALSSKFRVIYNAIDVQGIQQKALLLSEDKRMQTPYILAVERLEESQKDIKTLLKAYQLLRTRYGRTEKLYLIGKGNSQAMLEEKARELGIDADVCFLGFMPNPYHWIKKCALLMHSAKFEGLPTILIESLALHKLIVATNCPTGPQEILDGGKAGILVPVGDAEQMAEAANSALTDTTLQQKLYAGAARQIERFTFKHTLEQFYKLLN